MSASTTSTITSHSGNAGALSSSTSKLTRNISKIAVTNDNPPVATTTTTAASVSYTSPVDTFVSTVSGSYQQQRERQQQISRVSSPYNVPNNASSFSKTSSSFPKSNNNNNNNLHLNYKTRMQSSENLCDPDEAEQELKQIFNRIVSDFASAAGNAVADVQKSLENEFKNVGLECFASDYSIQKRIKELFPSQRRLDDIEQLLRDATSNTLKRRIQHRFADLENSLKSIHRNSLSEPMATATRNFVQDMLHYISVTVGNRGEFLRHRFNLRLKTLIKAAQDGQLDSWNALSDEDENDEAGSPVLFLSNATKSGASWRNQDQNATAGPLQQQQTIGASNVLSLSSSQNAPSSVSELQQQPSSAMSMTKQFTRQQQQQQYASASRIPTQNQKVARIEGSSTAVLDELTELRVRLDRVTSTRHEEIESLKKSYEKELAQQAAAAQAREHLLRTEAADLRVRVSDMDRVLKQTGDLIQRLHAQSIRYRKEINLFVELSRDESLGNCYPLMAKRLTQMERDDHESDKNGERVAKDDEVLQRIGIHLFSFEGKVPSIQSLSKQHDLLNTMRAALMNHEKTKEVLQENSLLKKENDGLKLELIEIRNKSKRFEVDLRNEASARETKLVKEVRKLKEMWNAASEKLRTSHIAMIGTNDELTGDLILKLQDAELKNKHLATELQIAQTVPACSRALSKEPTDEENKRASLVLRRKRSLVDDDVQVVDDEDDDEEIHQEMSGQLGHVLIANNSRQYNKKTKNVNFNCCAKKNDDDDDGEDEDEKEFEEKVERLFTARQNNNSNNNSRQLHQQRPSSSNRPTSANTPTVLVPPHFVEPDVRSKILLQLVSNNTNNIIPRPPSSSGLSRPMSATSSSASAIRKRREGSLETENSGSQLQVMSGTAVMRNANPTAITTEAAELFEYQVSKALNAPPKSARSGGMFWEDENNNKKVINNTEQKMENSKSADRQLRAAVTTLMRPMSAQGKAKKEKENTRAILSMMMNPR